MTEHAFFTNQDMHVTVPAGFSLRVEFLASGGQLSINGQDYAVNETGLVVPANGQQTQGLAQRVLEVGQRLRDGTVVFSVDPAKNKALFVPAKIFGGQASFDEQDQVVEAANGHHFHGHTDWRRITDDEGYRLARDWAKVTTQTPAFFWLASLQNDNEGRVLLPKSGCYTTKRHNSDVWVPLIRSGPARYVEAELT